MPLETGSFLQPQVQREARTGYVIAELYQDVHLDVASGVYDPSGALLDRYWRHDPGTQSCSVDLTLADQHGRGERAPAATPPPLPMDTVSTYVYDADGKLERIDTIHVAPAPDPDAATPTPPPLASSPTWNGWKGRPISIEADGLAVLDAPRDVNVFAYLSLRTGADSGHNSHAELARMPLPDANWSNGSAHIRLPDASGRILLARDDVDAHYRAAVLSVDVSPLANCSGLRLRWQRPAAVVVKALTAHPFLDWGDGGDDVVAALYAAVGPDDQFDDADLKNGASSSVAGHIVIPSAAADSHLAFAIRSDLAPNGVSDIRQTGSAFNARDAFSATTLEIQGTEFQLYVSLQPWRAQQLGGEWSLTP